MDNDNFFFHLLRFSSRLPVTFFGMIDAVFILVTNEKVLWKGKFLFSYSISGALSRWKRNKESWNDSANCAIAV